MACDAERVQAARAEKEQQEKLLAEFEMRRRMMGTVVPTEDAKVRGLLRQLGEPVTLFGEREVRIARGGGWHPGARE
jgi:U4/U6 small nuclear ribonucleoprotein PRP4